MTHATKTRPNPFEALLSAAPDSPEPLHASDDPGRAYDGESTRSSGVHAPSEPRRPGTGERQAPRKLSTEQLDVTEPLVPGEILFCEADVEINVGQPVTTLKVVNVSDRPVQIGSHYHFAEVNDALEFDRKAAWGQRLNVLSGGGMRFEPGATDEVQLIPIRGKRIVVGLRGHCGGELDE